MRSDAAYEAFKAIKHFAEHNAESIVTEQDARFQLIDRILTEVLGWPRESIHTEPHLEDGRIDYLMTQGGRNKFVVEAKRTAISLVDTKHDALNFLSSMAQARSQPPRYLDKRRPTAATQVSNFARPRMVLSGSDTGQYAEMAAQKPIIK